MSVTQKTFLGSLCSQKDFSPTVNLDFWKKKKWNLFKTITCQNKYAVTSRSLHMLIYCVVVLIKLSVTTEFSNAASGSKWKKCLDLNYFRCCTLSVWVHVLITVFPIKQICFWFVQGDLLLNWKNKHPIWTMIICSAVISITLRLD